MAADQVRIQLSTRHADLELPEKPGPILVQTNLRRLKLSTLVNDLLQTSSTIPFEFLINGEFLRSSLNDFLTEHGISAEKTLSVEYLRAQLPPTTQASFEHDDWVCTVDVLSGTSAAGVRSANGIRSGHERILSGSYDGLLRVWDMSGNILATSPASTNTGIQGVLAARFISPSAIVSSNWTRMHLWDYAEGENQLGEPASSSSSSLTPTLNLIGHSMAVNALAVHAPSQRILSASDDATAAVWSSNIADASKTPVPSRLLPVTSSSSKRRKINPTTSTPSAGPLTVLSGHTAPVTGVIFHPVDHTVAYTTSQDRTFRTWDLETSACVTARTPVAHTGLSALCGLPELGLVALGTAYSSVLLVDPREGAGSGRSVVLTLKGHRNDVSSLAVNPSSGFGLVSGSYDGTCRVWDVRNPRGVGLGEEGKYGKAAFRIPRKGNLKCDEVVGGEGVKVFDVVWDKDIGIISGSEDRTVQVDRS